MRFQQESESSRPCSDILEPTEDEVRKRAYEIYQERGARAEMALQDWLQAERELRNARLLFR